MATKKEKQVENEVMPYLIRMGWSVDVYESKAIYSIAKRGYRKNPSIVEGHSDIGGADPNGHASYIELKAPTRGKMKVRPEQDKFLRRKIMAGCFAVVVCSIEMLELYYRTWLGEKNRRAYLYDLLLARTTIISLKDKRSRWPRKNLLLSRR